MSKFKLTQTATEVQNILNNSLQKPTGLTKTKLVGVGVNGQENIEIGDNLTLANGKLSSAAGGGVNGLQSDAEGNLTASKNLGVDGKLTLKSLVSASNPDGDITKELGGPTRHGYRIIGNNTFHYTVYITKNYNFQIGKVNEINDFKTNDNYKELRAVGTYPAAGYFENPFSKLILNTFQIRNESYPYHFNGYDLKNSETTSITVDKDSIRFFYVVQLY